MGHPAIDNKSPFAHEVLYLVDEESRPLVVTVVKGTFSIARGACYRAEKQLPVNLSGAHWGEDPETSSYKYEPECAFFKPATDVVLVVYAYAPRRGIGEMQVALTVGPMQKGLHIFGERAWIRAGGSPIASRPVAFEKMPLVYERGEQEALAVRAGQTASSLATSTATCGP